MILDNRKLSGKEAAELVHEDASDISRIRKLDIDRYSIERLTRIVVHLNRRPTITLTKIDASEHNRVHI